MHRRRLLFALALPLAYALSCGSTEDVFESSGGGGSTDAGTDASIGGQTGTGGHAGSSCPPATPLPCGSLCIDPSTNPDHCGSCGHPCSPGFACVASACSASGCTSPAQCEDAFACTIDDCQAGKCTHAAGPNQGVTACPDGFICDLYQGCIAAKACATPADCADSDPCTVDETCDAVLSLCRYSRLDKDGDGHPPVGCGGDDCDDTNNLVAPGLTELCDGKDNNCQGTPDEGATCPSSLAQCSQGTCVCRPEYTCGQDCVDRLVSKDHCGQCFLPCPGSATCVNGSCTCQTGTLCSQGCVDTTSDAQNCGSCGHHCAVGASCVNSNCQCATGQTECAGACVNTNTNAAHCGQCGHGCSSLEVCQGGHCTCTKTVCSGQCVDTASDPEHCGNCTTVCNPGVVCVSSTCWGSGGSGGGGILPDSNGKCGVGKMMLFGGCFP